MESINKDEIVKQGGAGDGVARQYSPSSNVSIEKIFEKINPSDENSSKIHNSVPEAEDIPAQKHLTSKSVWKTAAPELGKILSFYMRDISATLREEVNRLLGAQGSPDRAVYVVGNVLFDEDYREFLDRTELALFRAVRGNRTLTAEEADELRAAIREELIDLPEKQPKSISLPGNALKLIADARREKVYSRVETEALVNEIIDSIGIDYGIRSSKNRIHLL